MKILNFALPALAVLFSTSVIAQGNEGQVVYEQKVNMHKRLPPEADQMRAMIPEFQTRKSVLLYTPTASLFKNLPEEQNEMPEATSSDGNRRMVFRMAAAGDAETYRDYEQERMVESRELGPKKYLIEDSLRPVKWKLSQGETMTILGKVCYKATATVEGMGGGGFRMMRTQGGNTTGDTTRRTRQPEPMEVVAWYTPDVESSAGPENYFGLPGLILKVDVDNGFMTYNALSLETQNKQTVKAPTSGKKITRDEFRKLAMQEFGGRPGGPGPNRQIIINQ